MRGGELVFARGYGAANLEYDVPITPSTVFHVASVSKQFTALAVALLVAEGEVSWDDDIRRHVPELPDFGTPITLRHLAHHTSGVRDQWAMLQLAGWRWGGDVIRQSDVLDLLSRQTALNFAPGSDYLYSNSGYTLLAVVVERVSGQTLRAFTSARLFGPLGMARTVFRDDHTMLVRDRAYAYTRAGLGGYRLSIPDFAIVGASSLFTTVEDLARWNGNFTSGEVGGADVLRKLQARGALDDGARLSATYCIMATGCLSAVNRPAFEGLERFEGAWYHTGAWPHEGVSFAGQHVGIIGTGSSAIQSIPLIAAEAQHLTVFQRQPNYTIPARNGPMDEAEYAAFRANYAEHWRRAKTTPTGAMWAVNPATAAEMSPEQSVKRGKRPYRGRGGGHRRLDDDLPLGPCVGRFCV
jgi:CubicO group peptidase (beta-lactamase class C family)